MMDLMIEHWPLDRLVPYARNARTHSDEQVAQIAGSIAEFGFVNPVLVSEDGVIVAGHGRVLAGHGRVLAARELGMTEAPVIVLPHLSETQARVLRIADNQIALNAGWDEGLLRASIEEILDAEGGDELVSLIGFPEDFLDDLLADPEYVAAGNIDDDEAPEPPDDPVSKPGDLWLLGNHRLYCGDATVLADVERALDGGLADLCFTDPPYNVDYGNSAKDKMRGKGRRILNDNLGEGFERFLFEACVNVLTVTKGAAYICMSSSELHTLQRAFTEAGGHWSTFVIWAKNTFTLGRADYQRQYEPILYGWKEGSDHFWCGARDQGDVWFVDKPHKNDLHPTMKPAALIERAVRNSSKSRDTVLDPFGGSGSTLIACEKTGRQARLVELDPKYADVIVKRWQELTGKAATLDGDGRTFEEIAAGREAAAA